MYALKNPVGDTRGSRSVVSGSIAMMPAWGHLARSNSARGRGRLGLACCDDCSSVALEQHGVSFCGSALATHPRMQGRRFAARYANGSCNCAQRRYYLCIPTACFGRRTTCTSRETKRLGNDISGLAGNPLTMTSSTNPRLAARPADLVVGLAC